MALAPQRNVIPSAARDLLSGLEAYVGAQVNKRYRVYILASRSRNLYTGMTNSMMRRLVEHRENRVPGFTSKYRIHRLVYIETYRDVRVAIRREKEIKSWRREKRVALIEAENPTWRDLAEEWFAKYPAQKQIPPAKNRPAG
ncbi:MAG: GIY-YIG nuclease family protein [Candidatus Acidiferrales bacterium]